MLLPSILKKCVYSGARVCARSVRTDPFESRKKNGIDNLTARKEKVCRILVGRAAGFDVCCVSAFFHIVWKAPTLEYPDDSRRLDDGKLATRYVWVATRFTYTYFFACSHCIVFCEIRFQNMFSIFSPCRNPSQTDEDKFCKGKF